MKTKALPMLLLCAALGLQCSDDNGGETDEISVRPQPKNGTSSPLAIKGYTDATNARLFVTGVDSVEVAPKYAYVADYIHRYAAVYPGSINATDVYFDLTNDDFLVKLPEPPGEFSLLCVDIGNTEDNLLLLPQWQLSYAWNDTGGLIISGRGRGSHVLELFYEQYDAWKASEVVFEFKGELGSRGTLARDNLVRGKFSIIETSPKVSYNLAIYGTLTIELDLSF